MQRVEQSTLLRREPSKRNDKVESVASFQRVQRLATSVTHAHRFGEADQVAKAPLASLRFPALVALSTRARLGDGDGRLGERWEPDRQDLAAELAPKPSAALHVAAGR